MIDRDTVITFIEERKPLLVIIVSAVLLILLVFFVAALGLSSGKAKKEAALLQAQKALALAPEELWLPAEPLPVPGLQFFRELRTVWSAEDVKQWYTVPDEASLGALRSAGQKQINALLESVP